MATSLLRCTGLCTSLFPWFENVHSESRYLVTIEHKLPSLLPRANTGRNFDQPTPLRVQAGNVGTMPRTIHSPPPFCRSISAIPTNSPLFTRARRTLFQSCATTIERGGTHWTKRWRTVLKRQVTQTRASGTRSVSLRPYMWQLALVRGRHWPLLSSRLWHTMHGGPHSPPPLSIGTGALSSETFSSTGVFSPLMVSTRQGGLSSPTGPLA